MKKITKVTAFCDRHEKGIHNAFMIIMTILSAILAYGMIFQMIIPTRWLSSQLPLIEQAAKEKLITEMAMTKLKCDIAYCETMVMTTTTAILAVGGYILAHYVGKPYYERVKAENDADIAKMNRQLKEKELAEHK